MFIVLQMDTFITAVVYGRETWRQIASLILCHYAHTNTQILYRQEALPVAQPLSKAGGTDETLPVKKFLADENTHWLE